MFRLLVVLALLSCVYGIPKSKHRVVKKHGQKIVGGQATTIEKHPFQVSLLTNDGSQSYICGGSIISDQWILTAAHCMENIKSIEIRAGSSNLYSGGTTYDSTNYTVHPEYNRRTHDNDVAVVYVSESMELNNTTMKAVMLASSSTPATARTKTIVSGWGTTRENGQASDILRSVQVPIVSNTTCSRNYGVIGIKITDNMLCAGYTEGLRDSCQGDSGGPQVLESGEQIGVVSFGYGCARPLFPGVYAKVATLRSWINDATGV